MELWLVTRCSLSRYLNLFADIIQKLVLVLRSHRKLPLKAEYSNRNPDLDQWLKRHTIARCQTHAVRLSASRNSSHQSLRHPCN